MILVRWKVGGEMKRLAVLSLLLLVLAACNTTNESASNENVANNDVNEIENNEENSENNVKEENEADDAEGNDSKPAAKVEEQAKEEPQPSASTPATKEAAPKTKVEKKDSPKKTEEKQGVEKPEKKETTKKTEKKEDKKVEKDNPEQMLISMAEDIMKAQFNKDVGYLESIISKGTKMEGNSFVFNNVTYPHKQDFFTEETASELSFRYPHKNSEESYVIGYAAKDKVNDYSFVIDFEFVLEDGKWKMNDMDVNK